MKLEKCRICDVEIEEMAYGHPQNKGNSPYGLNICYDCLELIKRYMIKGKEVI